MIDYGVEYATIGDDGRLELDLSPRRVSGPMVPVIRVLRAWLEQELGDAIERTFTTGEIAALSDRLKTLALTVDHVLRADPVIARLGADKVLRVGGSLAVGGAGVYLLNVSIDQLGQVLAKVTS